MPWAERLVERQRRLEPAGSPGLERDGVEYVHVHEPELVYHSDHGI
jgi:hypothetical protein